jgi:poly-gamma-glutamate capsule biosynthesis protein CapA/YwtB (metallophosphatase superfamily)
MWYRDQLRVLARRLPFGLAGVCLPLATAWAHPFDSVEAEQQALLAATPIAVHGRVIDEHGQAIAGAHLQLIAWGDNVDNDGEAGISGQLGEFELTGLTRRNALLEVSRDGYYTEVLPIELQVGLDTDAVDLGEITLIERRFDRARLSFAGDAMFDRRMFSEGVLTPDDLAADTAALFRFVAPLLHADDHTAINLETAVTDDRSTPHPTKSYVFAAYRESAAALPGVGIDSVSVGNNHVYDYLELGMADTLVTLQMIGLPVYGGGMTPASAAATVLRPALGGVDVSLQGFSNFIGYDYGGEELQLITLADPRKGGALPAFNAELDAFVDAEVAAGRMPIPIIHGGTEYVTTQTSASISDYARTVEHGAGLVIGHHPHLAHGVMTIDAGDGPRFVFGSLGNFVFDQIIYETLRSYVVIVDVADGPGGPAVERVALAPYRIDDFAPRLLVGQGLADMGRHVAHLSTAERTTSGHGRAVVYAGGGRLHVVADEGEVETTDLLDQRNLTVANGTTGLVALDPYTDTDALARLSTSRSSTCSLGRDLLGIGDFEDPDVDGSYLEGDLWDQTSTHYIQSSVTHTGAAAAVLLRESSNSGRTSMWMDRPLAVQAGRAMTITGWHAGHNAGKFEVSVRWLSSSGSTISQTTKYTSQSVDYDWRRFVINATAPSNAVDLQVYFRHYPPTSGAGEVYLDDVAFVEWDPTSHSVTASGRAIATPNTWDFVRCSASNGALNLTLTHRVYDG